MSTPHSLSFVFATTSENQNSGGSFLVTLLFMGAIGAAMYFLMIRPQRRRLKESQELQRAISEGDEVITNSGIFGFVNAIDGDVVWLEIAEGTEIRVSRTSLLRRINPAVEPAGGQTASDSTEPDSE
ncbi:MAG: preprotein translocase subunit YajC [Actinomycetota bacterium]|nr:preprotein translocase subunit YajC [Actinomycetota bacterium]MDA3019271.1 preprotein translocase subunit YajC [Actinomycetota bacterium]